MKHFSFLLLNIWLFFFITLRAKKWIFWKCDKNNKKDKETNKENSYVNILSNVINCEQVVVQ